MNNFLHLAIIVTSLFVFQNISITAKGQHVTNVSATVVDNETGAPLPYATVYHKKTGNGTVTNRQGYFRLMDIPTNDTIQITFIGYESKEVIARDYRKPGSNIFLTQRAELVGEVIITGDDSYLYDILSDCSKTRTYDSKTAKTYFSLETLAGEKQVEMLECYYNGEYAGYNLNELNLKNGRIALAKYENKYFVSTEPSKVLCMYRIFDGHEYFPYNPLEMRKGKMKRRYELDLASKYKDEEGRTIYVIAFEPKGNRQLHFSGKAWIDSLENSILKIELSVDDASVHPLVPIWPSDTLRKVSMDISKTFETIGGRMYVKSIDFNYDLKYQHRDSTIDDIFTSAVLYAYNYDDQFRLPLFHYSEPELSDYRRINATPYNEFFWDNIEEFKLNDHKHRNEVFVKDKSTISNRTLFLRSHLSRDGFFEHPYVHWSGKRVLFKEDLPEPYDDEDTFGKIDIPLHRYQLKAQIYLDVNTINDSLHFITSTVLDPYESFFDRELSNKSSAFINMYFDLMEIERRKLEKEFRENCHTEEEIIETYHQKIRELEEISLEYFNETGIGIDKKGMKKWNAIIKNHLGIDNMLVFGLYQDSSFPQKETVGE